MPGPVPKRESQRRRRNRSDEVEKGAGARKVRAPRANPKWHPVARAWFNSLGRSGQSRFYEPSDWALAVLMAESISRDLAPQFVGFEEGTDGDGNAFVKPCLQALPMKGAALAAYLKGMSNLLVTEGDRRRLRLELERPGPAEVQAVDPKIARMSEYASRFAG
jgi:hypothetical protein